MKRLDQHKKKKEGRARKDGEGKSRSSRSEPAVAFPTSARWRVLRFAASATRYDLQVSSEMKSSHAREKMMGAAKIRVAIRLDSGVPSLSLSSFLSISSQLLGQEQETHLLLRSSTSAERS